MLKKWWVVYNDEEDSLWPYKICDTLEEAKTAKEEKFQDLLKRGRAKESIYVRHLVLTEEEIKLIKGL